MMKIIFHICLFYLLTYQQQTDDSKDPTTFPLVFKESSEKSQSADAVSYMRHSPKGSWPESLSMVAHLLQSSGKFDVAALIVL